MPLLKRLPRPVGLLAVLLLALVLVIGCAALPSLENREPSWALPQDQARETRIGRSASEPLAAHPGLAGIHPLPNAREAFATRVLMAQMADRTLDVQYYIWRADTTGLLLLDALIQAADRGVRVRLLLDDMNTAGMDPLLRAADAHPNLDLRLFNPFVVRSARWMGFVSDFSRLNRRMHNKSFTADNLISVVGGRNVGDEYFGATEDVLFSDLDVMVAGEVVSEVSSDFDRYWGSASSYPAELILGAASQVDRDHLDDAIRGVRQTERARDYLRAVERSDFVQEVRESDLQLEWARTRVFSDAPGKGLGYVEEDGLLSSQLSETIGPVNRQFNLVSPYFIPTETGVAALRRMTERGIRVRVLTNSLSATDVAIVHSGYARYREDLLEAGIELYEMKPLPEHAEMARTIDSVGASATSLHAKTFEVDGNWVFVGSYNFDPRSNDLNTELGFLIESPNLARQLVATFDETVPKLAYRVRLDDDGDLYWTSETDDGTERWDTEPGTGWFKRFSVGFFSLLPIEGLL
ncbi:phospholipase D family protein [Marinobacter bohaiensis]|uniref:phospholipase D family protein n=1 Tax=Marinobacter bohaiensis TaxID=2201898 RepID=UPI001D178B7C|nr:phospholipase D family protein [Marinobacter bohaiensis]